MSSTAIVVTSIGSVSGPFVVKRLKSLGHNVIGVNSPTRNPPPAARFCDSFHTIPHSADEQRYVTTLLELVALYRVDSVLPLTDPEAFLLSQTSATFARDGVSIAGSHTDSLRRVRDKLNLSREAGALDSAYFSVIPTFTDVDEVIGRYPFPIVRKPRVGRSSQGLQILTAAETRLRCVREDVIYQPFVDGYVITVDAWRSAGSAPETSCCSRVELVRSPRGLGLAVKVFHDPELTAITAALLDLFAISGLVNIEFIRRGQQYFLMDFNLRASAGLGFSYRAGVDFLEQVFGRAADRVVESNLCSITPPRSDTEPAEKNRPTTTL